MSFRVRLAALAAAAVAVALIAGSVGVYVVTTRSLLAPVDRSLVEFEQMVQGGRRQRNLSGGGPFGGPGGFVQLVRADGSVVVIDSGDGRGVVRASTIPELPVDTRTIAVASGSGERYFSTIEVEGVRLRVLTTAVSGGFAAQLARPITELDESLAAVRDRLLIGGLGGIGLAALLGLIVAERAVKPVEELTDLAEEVARTGDLSRRIEVPGEDEVGRLASTFNVMLANLAQARASQEQLVADASHELRTPLTSLRTNIEVLADVDRLDPVQRRALIDDVVVQLDEFGRLVGGLVELTRWDQPAQAAAPVRLDELAGAVVERASAFSAGRDIVLEARPTTVLAEQDRIERAVANLVDNAVKYGDGTIEVTVSGGTVTVRDHGPGIAQDDLPHVFDRFYRAPAARGAPGSGLGLSIAAQAAASHGGTLTVANADGGGAVFTLTLPELGPAETTSGPVT